VYDLWIVTEHGFVNFPGICSFSRNAFCKYIDADPVRYRKHRQILSIKQALPCYSVKIRENPNAQKKKSDPPIEYFRPASPDFPRDSRVNRDRCATILRRDSKYSRIRWCRYPATRARKMDPGDGPAPTRMSDSPRTMLPAVLRWFLEGYNRTWTRNVNPIHVVLMLVAESEPSPRAAELQSFLQRADPLSVLLFSYPPLRGWSVGVARLLDNEAERVGQLAIDEGEILIDRNEGHRQ